ncbi:AMP-dependent synthetase/ligase [Penicillium argentinense]|uniref:AMP-dependent synthetase/ligase n=1 Tax=Penicillium argentinense TaxID=1131581 RepID=A0A9W9FPY0_9EURO|nr:AMP-dependent synthetase/ligase [Penicillium argentinense]KAJ5104214.1 AMP-dependent synthetase/ligase [Penicillium argentinense]
MAPILLETTPLNVLPHSGPLTVQQNIQSDSTVDLLLSERPQSLIQLVEIFNAPTTVKNEHPDIQLQRLLQLAWVITMRAFTASTTIHVGEQYAKGRCFVGVANDTAGPTTQIHIDTQDAVQDLFSQVVNGLEALVDESCVNGVHGKDGQDTHYNTTFVYQRQPANALGPDQRPCMGRCHVCCPMPMNDPLEPEASREGLRLFVRHTPDDRLHAQLDVGMSRISAPLATSLLHSFNQALSSIGVVSTQTIGAVDLCGSNDRDQIANFTRSLAPSQDALLHDLCLRHVVTTPDAPAVRSWDGDLTYRELSDRSSRLAHWLVRHGVRPGTFVACTFYKSTWAIVARLAILMAGGAYICVDASDPPPYLASVLARTQIKIMLTSTGYAAKYADLVDLVFEVSEASLGELPSLSGVPCPVVRPSDACVVLFTSGSTGKPKGIIQEHRSYASALIDYIRVMEMGPHSRLFQFDAYAFDISNNDFLAPLLAGGCCCVPTASLTMDALMKDVNDLEANMMFATPSVAIEIDPDRVPTLETMCIGGEPVSDAVLARWLTRVKVVNQYGMGEVASLCAHNPNLQMGHGSVVGRPASGAIWIVNQDHPDLLMPVGAVGELLVEGPHISRGYLDHVSGKSENFLTTPPIWMRQLHADRPSHRFYRSGDLGRYRHDGTIELIGRKDTMLKLDGARVEAGQVEYVLRQHLSIGDAAVVDVLGAADGVGDPILGVYLYLASNPMNLETGPVEEMQFRPITGRHAIYALTQTLSEAVRQSLPTYYVPSLFLLVDRVPRTKSKKTDRRKLHVLGQAYYMAHREELREITVWPEWD